MHTSRSNSRKLRERSLSSSPEKSSAQRHHPSSSEFVNMSSRHLKPSHHRSGPPLPLSPLKSSHISRSRKPLSSHVMHRSPSGEPPHSPLMRKRSLSPSSHSSEEAPKRRPLERYMYQSPDRDSGRKEKALSLQRSERSVPYTREDLEKITIDIHRNIRDPSPTRRRILDPSEIKIVRRKDEGARPLFEREEIKMASVDLREDKLNHPSKSYGKYEDRYRDGYDVPRQKVSGASSSYHRSYEDVLPPPSGLTLSQRWQTMDKKVMRPSPPPRYGSPPIIKDRRYQPSPPPEPRRKELRRSFSPPPERYKKMPYPDEGSPSPPPHHSSRKSFREYNDFDDHRDRPRRPDWDLEPRPQRPSEFRGRDAEFYERDHFGMMRGRGMRRPMFRGRGGGPFRGPGGPGFRGRPGFRPRGPFRGRGFYSSESPPKYRR